MPFDPTLPQENTLIDAAQMRSQLNALNGDIQTRATTTAMNTAIGVAVSDKATHADLSAAIGGTALNPFSIAPMIITFSNPPTDSELYEVQSKFNELLGALQRPP